MSDKDQAMSVRGWCPICQQWVEHTLGDHYEAAGHSYATPYGSDQYQWFQNWWNDIGQHLPANNRDIAQDAWNAAISYLHAAAKLNQKPAMEVAPPTKEDMGKAGGVFDPSTSVTEVERLKSVNACLLRGIKAVSDLIDESGGVYGLHLNGDNAPWIELRAGGRFEEWLIEFDEALSECIKA